MIDGLRPYPDIKASGLPWLADIPFHWEVRRNGRLFGMRRQTGFPDLPVLEVSLRSGVRVRDFETGSRKQEIADRSKYQRAARGDIAYNMMRMWQGAVGVAPTDGLVSPAYVVARPFPDTNAAYYAYLFRTASYMREVDVFSRGIVPDRNRLYWEAFKQIPSAYPPLDEQRLIVRFLNWHGGQTAKLIQAKKRIIALLGEEKQAVIHRAITRGLDPEVKLKPSGVAWLGDVPRGWQITSLSAVSDLIQTGPFGSQLPASSYVRSGVPVINPSHLIDGCIVPDTDVAIPAELASRLARHRFEVGDIALARRGELGRCAVVNRSEAGWLCGTGTIKLRLKTGSVRPEYCSLIFGDPQLRSELKLASIGATMDNLNESMIGRLRIAVPPLTEQGRLLEFADQVKRSTNVSVDKLQSEIALVQEFRTRLIMDVVTGKIDVREMAVTLREASESELLDESTNSEELEEIPDVPESEDLVA